MAKANLAEARANVLASGKDTEWETRRKLLKQYGLEYRDYHNASRPFLVQTLLKQLALHFTNTFWGREAFLEMTYNGWNLGGDCDNGSDQFKLVIEHGNKFLNDYPHSEVSNKVRLETARAYETWWSLSRAGSDALFQPGDTYKHGAERARTKAIFLYKQYLVTTKWKDSEDIKDTLFRLERNIPTQQLRYFCFND